MTVNIAKEHPDLYNKLYELDVQVGEAINASGLDPKIGELVKLRVSQLNGCAYCLRMHTADALKLGETPERLALVAAWWECQYFTEAEQAALGLAEEVTRLSVPERTDWNNGSLTDEQISAITWLAIQMNAWNRLAVRSHLPVGPGDAE